MNGRRKTPAGGTAWKGLFPVGVAAGLALVVGGGLDVVDHRQRAEKKEHAASAAAKSEPTSPRFVVGVRAAGTALVVRDVRGGDVGLPVAAPPGRRFHRVASVKNGYVVSSYAARRVTFERLELEDDGRPKDLEEIPRATLSGVSGAYSDLAVGQDGDRIAYVTYRGAASRVDVVSARTGDRKAWTARIPARISGLSWAGDTLAFVWNPLRKVDGKVTEVRHQLRTLDTNAPSGDLKVSKPVLDLPAGTTAILARDGRTIITGTARNAQISVQAVSITTRRPTKVLARQASAGRVARLDTDPTGGHLLVSATDGRLYAEGAALPGTDLIDATW